MAKLGGAFRSQVSSLPDGSAKATSISNPEDPSVPIYCLPPFNKDDPDYPIGTDQAIFHDTGPVCRVPKHWERDYFLVDDIPIYYYVARAKDELGVKVGCSGLKSDRPLSAAAVQEYNKAGISVIIMALPNPGRSLGFMPYYRKVFEKFAFDNESPVHTLFHKDLPKFLYGHSTGGQILTRMITSPLNKGVLEAQNYVGAEIEAPFYEGTNLSENYNWQIKRKAFDLYACWNKNALPKETLGGLYYLHYTNGKPKLQADLSKAWAITHIPLKAAYSLNIAVKTVNDLYLSPLASWAMPRIPMNTAIALRMAAEEIREYLPKEDKTTLWYERNSEFRTPTYGQIQEDQHQGRKTYKLIQKENRKPFIPLTIIAAEDDPFSCTKTTRSEVASPLGADFRLSATGLHNSISEDRNCLEYSINKMRPHLLGKPIEEEVIEKDTELYETPAEIPNRWKTSLSGNRFGNIFKGSTRFLDPLTRVAKRLIGGSVGDPKVR